MMNERIKELADKASKELDPTAKCLVSDIWLDKFSTLLIEECVSVATDQRDWVENMVVFNERDKFWNKARILQSQRIIDKIRRHFGVE